MRPDSPSSLLGGWDSSLADLVNRRVFADEYAHLFHLDAFEGFALQERLQLPPFQHLIFDPPYSPSTHRGARSARANQRLALRFKSFTYGQLTLLLALAARHTQRWAVFTCDFRYVGRLAELPPPGWEFVRKGVWVKPGAAPQFTGDRPAMGHEDVVVLHRVPHPGCPSPPRMRWNKRGSFAVWTHPVVRGRARTGEPSQKPQSLYEAFLEAFTDVGEAILDPTCGSGTTLAAARKLGRYAVGWEVSRLAAERARRRLALGAK